MYKHDFIRLSETYLDSSIPDGLLEIDEYNLDRADNPNNIKKGRVCICYRESLPFQVISLPYLKEALLVEMTYNNKKGIMSVIYRFPVFNLKYFIQPIFCISVIPSFSTCQPLL